ncbi:aminotransferase class V-fold PLP-dependent enzyme [Shewanella glacialimarina]|uniref:aminotransferase class V-fold PLP-dependent enzyme n=1 Tax=Shewanella glacialimarina TaxID=2590884 RepID=UPI001CF7F861|nr:aminotransferase class V-fold PLP-dependent enzyme [Shewanella glacialimarina]UCX03464.1 aminotransferase class V-fold PLP-dependent enzyme [Shewanella glacialimarina]
MNNNHDLSQIYLDANATTPVLPQAAQAALSAMELRFGNPSSSHITGLRAKDLMEQTRNKAKQILGSENGKIIFTSGATEGIQTAILSALISARETLKATQQRGEDCYLLYGATEHKAVPESLKHWNALLGINAKVIAIPVDGYGNLDHDFISQYAPKSLMICTMAVNNETGVYQDLSALENTIRQASSTIFWLVDCVQALGKISLNLAQTTIDYAPFSGHKLYAPKGIGFIYIRENAPLTPVIAGGGQESGQRSGTENLPGMAAINVVFDQLVATDSCFASHQTLHAYRQQLADTLRKAFPQIVFNHSFDNSVPTTLNFAIKGFSSKEIMDLFDAANIRVSSGSACSSKVTRSFVLDAMGLPAWQSESAIRLSFGPAMTQAEVSQACQRIISTAQALTQSCMVLDSANIDDKTPLNGLVQLRSGASCTWVYIEAASKKAFIIDPLPELTERLDTLLQCQQLDLIAIIDTHGHADHVSGRVLLAEKHPQNIQCDGLGWPQTTLSVTENGRQLEYIQLADKWLVKVPTPGHTGDSISLLLCQPLSGSDTLASNTLFAFCGDTILMGTLGRTNFDSSSAVSMYDSIQLLSSVLAPQSLICASHDYQNEFATHLSAECLRNPLLQQVSQNTITVDEFVARKLALDSQLNDQTGSEILCGALPTASCSKLKPIIEYSAASLDIALHSSKVKLIDIREPHEYALHHTSKACENVPLTRLVQFMQQHLHDKDSEWVLVCRSGSRSLVAAQAMQRLGFSHIAHLKGGYALAN